MNEENNPAPSSPAIRKRAEELLGPALITYVTSSSYGPLLDAMLAFGEEREVECARRYAADAQHAHAVGRRAAFEEAARMALDMATSARSASNLNEAARRIQAALSAASRPGADKERTPPAAAEASSARTERNAVKSEESSAVSRAADRNTGAGSNPAAGGHLPDAEILERAAEIMRTNGYTAGYLEHAVGNLRARPAAEPDWAEAVAREWCCSRGQDHIVPALAALLRERFGQLVEALEWYASNTDQPGRAQAALARLRAGAKGERT